MRAFSVMRSMLAASVFALAGVFGVGGVAQASVVAVLGTMSIGDSAIVTCRTEFEGGCSATAGTDAGWLPAGSFTHQIFFDTALIASGAVINTTLDLSPIAVTSVKLYSFGGTMPTAGDANLAGTLIGTATSTTIPSVGTIWAMSGVLDPAGTFFLEIIGSTTGTEAQYSQQVALSAVPLPPALILLATALFGLIGVGRIRRRRAVAAS